MCFQYFQDNGSDFEDMPIECVKTRSRGRSSTCGGARRGTEQGQANTNQGRGRGRGQLVEEDLQQGMLAHDQQLQVCKFNHFYVLQ